MVRHQPNKTTILFLDHTAELGGGELALAGLVKNLNLSEFHPIVILCADGPLVEKFHSFGIDPIILPISSEVAETRKDSIGGGSFTRLKVLWGTLSYAGRLARLLRKYHVDILHANSLKADIIGGIAGRMAGVKVIWHVRDRIEDDYLPPKVVKFFRWLSNRVPHYVIANSKATLETLHLNRKPGRAIYSGIELPPLEIFSSIQSHPTVGLIGRVTPWKGQHIFIDAAAIVLRTIPNVKFQIVGAPLFGEEEYLAQIENQVKSLNIADSVGFLGFRKDVPALMSAMTIVVHASTTGEPYGQVVAQGMAAAKPVIGTNGGGVPELIVDGVTGILVPMGDSDAMANAIILLLSNPIRAAEMGAAGRKRAEALFTVEVTTREVEKVYGELLR